MSSLSHRERGIRQRLKEDFGHYAAKCLKIRTKRGAIVPLVLNAVQRKLHEAIEAQRERIGRVRLLVLKARQPGVSTYVAGRFFWTVTHRKGVRAFILTHEDRATTNLFGMAKRFYDHCPSPVRPQIKASNAKELDFGRLDSGYRVGTAKATGVEQSGQAPTLVTRRYGSESSAPARTGRDEECQAENQDCQGMFHDQDLLALLRRSGGPGSRAPTASGSARILSSIDGLGFALGPGVLSS